MSRSLRYLSGVEEDQEYYITNNFRPESISGLLNDIREAQEKLKKMERALFLQYQKATMATDYITITAKRYQNQYRDDKKVYISISVHKIRTHEGEKVASDLVYGDSKEFRYKEMNAAIEYIKVLKLKYPGAEYTNESPYKKLSIH